MIPKSGYRFSEKIMLKEQAKAKWRFNLRPFGFMALPALLLAVALPTPAMAQSGTHSFSGLCAYYPAHGNGLTAAHRTLPFGTRLRVTDPKTGRSVTVLINDRGPFGRHRVLDVSPSAARALGMMGRGVIFVQAEVL
jgi:rare lipoprotein A